MRNLARPFRLLLILFVIFIIVYLYWGSTNGAIFWRRSAIRTWVHQVETREMGLREIIERKLSKPIAQYQEDMNRFVTAEMDVNGFTQWLRKAVTDPLVGAGFVWYRGTDTLAIVPLSVEIDSTTIQMLHYYLDAKYRSEYVESHKPRWKDTSLDSLKAEVNRKVGFSTYRFMYYLDYENYPTRQDQAEAMKVVFGIIWNHEYYRDHVLPGIIVPFEADPREYGLSWYNPLHQSFYNGILLVDMVGDTLYSYGRVQVPRDSLLLEYSIWPWYFELPVEWSPGWRLYVQNHWRINPMLGNLDLMHYDWDIPSNEREDRIHAWKMITLTLVAPWMVAERPPMLLLSLSLGTLFLIILVQITARKRQRDFIAHVSHELRTPVAKVKLFAETLRQDRAVSEKKEDEYLEVILRESDHLSVLVDNTLNLARLDAGRMKINKRSVDLSEWLNGVVEKHRISLTGSGFNIELKIESDLPQIKADPEALELALNNLLDNAVKYSEDVKEIEIQAKKKSNNRVQIAVSDRGIGVPAGKRKTIFKRFHRIKPTDQEPVGGAGVGLSIVKEIVKKHHGRVWCQSQDGSGSIFTMELLV